MFHLRRVDFHQDVRKVGNGTGGAVPDAAATPAATAITGEEHREIADGPGPVKGKSAKVRATMILLDHNTKIGRNPELVDVVLHSVHYSNMISRDHSEIIGEVDKNGQFVQYHIRDNSLNGTYVNEIRVDGKQLLKEGDLIKFGHANGAAIKPGQFAPQVQSEFVFKFERALADYHYCGFTEQRARLYPGLKRAYLQVYSDRAEPELIPFEKGSVTLCGSAQPSTTVVPPASAVHPLPATTSRRPKTLTKHAALTTIDTTSPAAQAAPSTSAAQGVTANASSVTTSRPVVTNTATTATVNPYAVVASNLQPANPPALPQLSAGMPGHTIVDDVAAAAWMQQQQQQLQRYGGGFALNALAAAASSYLSQNPASYAAALWPWAGPSRLQPNLATDWNQLRQHAAAAAYPGGAPAVAALHQHLQQVPQFASPYSLTASNAPSFISTSITGASSHGFALPAAVASIASAFSSLASTCYGGSVASTPASSGSDSTTSYSNIAASRCAAVYSNSTTPASAAKLPNYLGAPGTASSPVGSLPAGLAAVLPALAGRPNALAQWTTPTASAFSVPPAGTPSSACPVASLAPSENASDASLALSGSASQVPQDPHPNQPLKSASGGIRLIASSASSTSSLSSATPDKPLSALSETSLSTITSDAKETPPKSHGKSEIASPVPRRFQVGDVKAEDNLSNCRVEAKPQATFAPHEVRSVCDAEPSTSTASDAKDSLMRISGVVDCRPSPSVFVRNSDGGAVPKNEEDAPVPSTPEPAKRHERKLGFLVTSNRDPSRCSEPRRVASIEAGLVAVVTSFTAARSSTGYGGEQESDCVQVTGTHWYVMDGMCG
ncbi:hypothetical protein AAVH_23746 [Aphelenchoides avenae]|nr:hypothetical protein AAVH_23746 [Aphelenchus avenae]